MTTAPRAPIARWAAELGLPDDAVAALAPWLGRLALAVGPRAGAHADGGGELDGVDGLARRGSYDRLVLAEWALADELPDEFLRRAASGEHVFVARARRRPPARRRTLALVSAGPAQLGAPRLAHLAALLVLARRAATAGAALRWGVLERPGDGGHDGVTPEGVRRLLAARTAVTATAAEVEAWRAAEAAGAAGGAPADGPADEPDDVWLIGGPEVVALAAPLFAGALVVRERVDPVVRALDVEVRKGGARQIQLDLPPADVCARLLRDPFGQARARPAAVASAAGEVTDLWFVAGDRKLVVARGDQLELWPVPGSPREPVGATRPVRIPDGERLVAFGARRRAPVLVTCHEEDEPGVLRLRDPARKQRLVRVAAPPALATGAARPGAMADLSTLGGVEVAIAAPPGRVIVVDAGRAPVGREPEDGAAPGAAVIGAAAIRGGLLYARHDRDHLRVTVHELRARGATRVATVPLELDDGAPLVAFGAQLGRGAPVAWGPVAIATAPGRWSVVWPDHVAALAMSATVHGVVLVDGDPRLVVGYEDGRRVALVGATAIQPLPRAGGTVTTIACGVRQPLVAWATDTGEVVVYALLHGAPVLRAIPEPA